MPDISMCVDHECPSAKKCYRHEATPNPFRQAYSEFERSKEDERCSYFYPLPWEKEPLADDA